MYVTEGRVANVVGKDIENEVSVRLQQAQSGLMLEATAGLKNTNKRTALLAGRLWCWCWC